MKWTKEEENYLIDNYCNKDLKLIDFEKHLNRNRDSIAYKAVKLGVSRGTKQWDREDEEFLIKNYENPNISPSFFETTFNVKWNNIVSKAHRLGLVRNMNVLTDKRHIEINDPDYIYKCRICKIPKPNSQYSKDKNQAKGRGRGYVTQCKECRRIYNRTIEVKESKRRLVPLRRKKNRMNSIYWSSISNSRNRKLEHSITQEYLSELFSIQKGLCYYTNKPMLINTENCLNSDDSVSIDRFDSSKGYIIGNIVLCRWVVNRMKNDLKFEQFLKIVSDINNNFNK